jgi:hypothetical protein
MAPRPNGQRLERRETTASCGVGPARLAAAAHRGSDRRSAGDGERVPEGGRGASAPAARLGPAAAGKAGQRDVHRLWLPKTPSTARSAFRRGREVPETVLDGVAMRAQEQRLVARALLLHHGITPRSARIDDAARRPQAVQPPRRVRVLAPAWPPVRRQPRRGGIAPDCSTRST